ncbi:hypothetical protein DY000_02016223 [Brassica cretica]|uniref:Uncharacterized protein n=1 Tax=Brassica cretica TaxID=69181 RepID=A0ABQ7D696_BRACR|nr:hypothetical protein DY000_02016223 [Brassica cretica]
MENIELGRASINEDVMLSSDVETEESTDTELPTSIDTAQPEAGKSSLTELIDEEVVQTEPIGQLRNETSQTKQGTEIPVEINPTLIKGEEIRLPLQDYLDPGRTYSNRSAIKIPGDDTKKSKFNADYYCMGTEIPVEINPTLIKGEEIRLPLQDYLDPGRTYSNRSAIKIPGDDTKKSKFNADYYCMIENDALSDMKNQLEEETSYSDPYLVLNIDSFTQAYDIAVKSRTGKEKFNIRQALTGNRKTKSDFYGKINMVYEKLMEKADSLSELIRKLESQVAEIATAIKRETRRLPGRTDLNPRCQVSAVMLRSGKRLATNTKNDTEIGSSANADETGESNSQPILLDDPDPKTSRENRKSTAEKNKEKTIDLEVEDDSYIEAEIDRHYGNHVDRPVKPIVDQLSDNPIDRHSTQPEPTIERVYRTLPPYPPKRQTKKSLEYAICKKALDRITMEIRLRATDGCKYRGREHRRR